MPKPSPPREERRWFQESVSPYAWEQDGLGHIKLAWTSAGGRSPGFRANATLTATLASVTDEKQGFDDLSLRLRSDLSHDMWRAAISNAADRLCLPDVDERALAGLKFSEALPHRLAVATLAARLADLGTAAQVLAEPTRFVVVN